MFRHKASHLIGVVILLLVTAFLVGCNEKTEKEKADRQSELLGEGYVADLDSKRYVKVTKLATFAQGNCSAWTISSKSLERDSEYLKAVTCNGGRGIAEYNCGKNCTANVTSETNHLSDEQKMKDAIVQAQKQAKEAAAEIERFRNLRSTALAKLTPEERISLGQNP